MEYKGYGVVARASRLPAGHFKSQFAVYRTNSASVLELVYQGLIASPDYTNPAAADAHAIRVAQAWIDIRARKHWPRVEQCATVGTSTRESRTPATLVWE